LTRFTAFHNNLHDNCKGLEYDQVGNKFIALNKVECIFSEEEVQSIISTLNKQAKEDDILYP
jgi:hypothetical protein